MKASGSVVVATNQVEFKSVESFEELHFQLWNVFQDKEEREDKEIDEMIVHDRHVREVETDNIFCRNPKHTESENFFKRINIFKDEDESLRRPTPRVSFGGSFERRKIMTEPEQLFFFLASLRSLRHHHCSASSSCEMAKIEGMSSHQEQE